MQKNPILIGVNYLLIDNFKHFRVHLLAYYNLCLPSKIDAKNVNIEICSLNNKLTKMSVIDSKTCRICLSPNSAFVSVFGVWFKRPVDQIIHQVCKVKVS